MAAITLTEENFEAEVLQSDKPVLVDFWATWCGPCQKQGPIVEDLADELTDVKVGKLDVDEAGAIAEKFSIMSIPTVIVFKNGEPVAKNIGLATKESLLELLNQ
ncbi:MAG: thioredoxin [Lachnospiraceae bacterium]|nr:thioredoxin [Lachnospiraceae bacterium]